MYTKPEEYPFAILYFTGSGDFNQRMRNEMNEKGFTMNEYCVKDNLTKKKIDHIFHTEKDIFDHFGFQYVIPEKVKHLIDNGCLGQKSGAGFYKKIEKGVIHVFDFDSMDYRPINKKRFKAIALAKEQNTLQGNNKRFEKAPSVGIEPTANSLKGCRSTV